MAKYTVVSAIKQKDVTTANGVFVSYVMALKDEAGNDLTANILQKPETPVPSGEISGEITADQWGNKFKKERVNPGFSGQSGGGGFSPKDTESIQNQVCLKASVEFMNGPLASNLVKKSATIGEILNIQLSVYTAYKRFLAGAQPTAKAVEVATADPTRSEEQPPADMVQQHPDDVSQEEEIDLSSLPF